MQSTPNLNLNKPDLTDFYDINDFNTNADIIDNELAVVSRSTIQTIIDGTYAGQTIPDSGGSDNDETASDEDIDDIIDSIYDDSDVASDEDISDILNNIYPD